jgi:hypothetical protein
MGSGSTQNPGEASWAVVSPGTGVTSSSTEHTGALD